MTDLFQYAEDSRALRDKGMTRAAETDVAWSELAYLALVDVARVKSELHTDDLASFFLTPPSPNAWGAIWMRAIRNRVIEKTGRYRPSIQKIKHAHEYPIYRSLIAR